MFCIVDIAILTHFTLLPEMAYLGMLFILELACSLCNTGNPKNKLHVQIGHFSWTGGSNMKLGSRDDSRRTEDIDTIPVAISHILMQ